MRVKTVSTHGKYAGLPQLVYSAQCNGGEIIISCNINETLELYLPFRSKFALVSTGKLLSLIVCNRCFHL